MIARGNHVMMVNNTNFEICLNKDVVVNRAPYRLSFDERSALREIIIIQLKIFIIQESESPFASSILLVEKMMNVIDYALTIAN